MRQPNPHSLRSLVKAMAKSNPTFTTAELLDFLKEFRQFNSRSVYCYLQKLETAGDIARAGKVEGTFLNIYKSNICTMEEGSK